MVFDQLTDFMIVVLLVAAAVSGVVGEARDAIAILVIVVLNAAPAFVATGKAKTMKAGMALAAESIDSGAAAEKLARLVERTHP